MMEYKDYKTGEAITREQYIANGLERGTLLVRNKCGCVVIQDRTADAYIVYCHKHGAAPDMYEALKEVKEALSLRGNHGADQRSYPAWPVHYSGGHTGGDKDDRAW